MLRRLTLSFALACALACATAVPSSAVVGGSDASPGEYPAVAQITFGKGFLCTGTLIAPNWVLTAGHCSSLTGAAVASPVTFPPALIDVRIGNHRSHTGGEVVPVRRVVGHANYLATKGYDVSLLELSRTSAQPPVQVSGAGETSLWAPGTLETIVGWGAVEEDGPGPSVLQEAQVPIVADPDCARAYSTFEARTQICAGYPQGGVDTCQGDSGGPLFGRTATGVLRVVGATSYGEGCARPNRPGVYARVGDSELREWIRAHAPAGVAP